MSHFSIVIQEKPIAFLLAKVVLTTPNDKVKRGKSRFINFDPSFETLKKKDASPDLWPPFFIVVFCSLSERPIGLWRSTRCPASDYEFAYRRTNQGKGKPRNTAPPQPPTRPPSHPLSRHGAVTNLHAGGREKRK